MHTFVGWLALGFTAGAAEPVAASAILDGQAIPVRAKTVPPIETLFLRAEHILIRPGKVIDSAQVLVRGGKIVAVGTDLAKPDGAREIQGRWICAGFIDPWAAIGLAGDVLIDSGATPSTRAVDGYDPYNFDHLRQDVLRSGVTVARLQGGATARVGGVGAVIRIVPGLSRNDAVLLSDSNLWMTIGLSGGAQQFFDQEGNPVTIQGFGSRAMDPFDRLESIDRLVSNLQSGKSYLASKNEYKHDLEAWQKTIAEKETELEKDAKKAKKDRDKAEKDALEKGKKFEEKKYKEDKKPVSPRYDEDSEILARAANGEIPLVVHANRAAEIRNLLQGTANMERLRLVLAGGSEAIYSAKELVERHIPVIVQPTPLGRNVPDEFEGRDLALAARLAHEGVTVLLGSGGLDAAASRDLPLLAEFAIGNGLDRDKALEALTIGAARAFDVADRLGSVESGKDADLQVLDGEPLVSTTHVRFVIAGGRVAVSPED